MEKKEVRLSVFVVPNGICTLGWCGVSHCFGSHIWDKDHSTLSKLEHFGITPVRGAKYVQVWILDRDGGNDSNWGDHGVPKEYHKLFNFTEVDEDGYLRAYAPKYLPYEFLKDRKEGEEIVLTENDEYIIKLKFEQLPYRYRSFGAFEDVIKALNARYDEQAEMNWHKECNEFIPVSGKNAHYDWAEEYKSEDI